MIQQNSIDNKTILVRVVEQSDYLGSEEKGGEQGREDSTASLWRELKGGERRGGTGKDR